VQVDVGQKRRNTAALDSSYFTAHSLPVLKHASGQPFLNQPHNALVPDSVLDEFHQPLVGQASEEVTNVGVEHPVHLLRRDTDRERVQRLMRAAPRSESVRESEKVFFVDGVHHLDDRTLDDFVFQRRDSERPLPPIRLRDVRSANWLRPVGASLQPFGKVHEVALQILP